MEGSEIVVAFAGTVCAIFILLTYLNAIRKDCFMSHHRQCPQNNNSAGGLTAAVIQTLPTFQLGEESRSDIGEDCAVCLGEFSEGEWMRLLPNCTHIFHASCIDAWFCFHSSCPICRKDVLCEFVGYGSFISVDMTPRIHQREGMGSQERQSGYHSEDDINPVMPTTPHKTVENAINEESSSRDSETGLCTAC